MVSCKKGPTCHAYTWQIGPFWQDTLEVSICSDNGSLKNLQVITWTNDDQVLWCIMEYVHKLGSVYDTNIDILSSESVVRRRDHQIILFIDWSLGKMTF